MIDRYQLHKARDEEGDVYYAVYDADLEMHVGWGSLEEMKEYLQNKESRDNLALWQ